MAQFGRSGVPPLAGKQMDWTFHRGELDEADVQALLALHFSAMQAHSPPEACHVLAGEALRTPDIAFWSLREAGALLGIGALKALEPGHGEIKSMRTAPHALGRGVGRAMLHHLIGEARGCGFRQLSLETGNTTDFAAALHLYESEGFVASAPFGGYAPTPFTLFYTRTL